MLRSKIKVNGDKKTKKCSILFWSRPLGRGPRAAFFGSGPRGCGYAGGKIGTCCLVFTLILTSATSCMEQYSDRGSEKN